MQASVDTLTFRNCPSCGELAPTGRPEVRSRISPDAASTEEFASAWAPTGRNNCFFDYRRCDSCGLLHNSVYLRPDLIDDAYSHRDDSPVDMPRHFLKMTQRRYLEAMEEFAPLEGVYLEVGPDIGLAAEVAVERGKLEKVVLVEPNRESRAVLTKMAAAHNPVVVSSLTELDDSVRADRVVLIHVLDHLVEPREDLIALRRRMTAGGLILVVVHNESSLLRRLLGRRWPPFRLQHPQLFSRRTLPAFLESCGFRVRSLRATGNTLSIRHLVRLGFSALGREPRWIYRVPEIGLTVRLGNILAVAEVT